MNGQGLKSPVLAIAGAGVVVALVATAAVVTVAVTWIMFATEVVAGFTLSHAPRKTT